MAYLGQRMLCWYCGHPMIWGSDFDAEDYGHEGPGIVSTFSCSHCKATAELTILEKEEE